MMVTPLGIQVKRHESCFSFHEIINVDAYKRDLLNTYQLAWEKNNEGDDVLGMYKIYDSYNGNRLVC